MTVLRQFYLPTLQQCMLQIQMPALPWANLSEYIMSVRVRAGSLGPQWGKMNHGRVRVRAKIKVKTGTICS